jgi:hypothetical protein
MENNFYVYAYLRENKKPYYIGKGRGLRAYSTCRAIPKPKDRKNIVFLRTNLSEEESFHWESFYIKRYGRKDVNTGILRNLTDGGEGCSNPNLERRRLQAEVGKKVCDPDFMGMNNPSHPSYGKGGKTGGKKACDPSNPRGVNNPNHPCYHERNKRSADREREKGHRIKLVNLETQEEYIFHGIRTAARALSLNPGSLSNMLNPNHPQKTCKNFTGVKL